MPIPIIVNNFNKFYEKSKIEEEIKAKKTKASWEDAKRGKSDLDIVAWKPCSMIVNRTKSQLLVTPPLIFIFLVCRPPQIHHAIPVKNTFRLERPLAH